MYLIWENRCIPYRFKDGHDDKETSLEHIEVAMITSPGRHDLVFPKGGWENDETVHEAACREAYEEAGLRGELHVIIYSYHLISSRLF